MAVEITVPRLGWNMDEGVFVGWLKQDGELVKAGEAIFSIETDKAVQEVESLDSGRLRINPDGPAPGQTVPVGTVIGTLVTADEQVEATAVKAAASPRARRKARELGLDWTTVKGTGRTGRVRERDVLAAADRRGSTTGPSPPLAVDGDLEIIPIAATRRTIAERMMRGEHDTAPVTLTTSVDATNLVNLRHQFKTVAQAQAPEQEPEEQAVGYTDLVVKLTALALEKHPSLNARWDGETIAIHRGIHIGVAVDTEAGLMVPVIRDVPRLGLREVAAQSRELIARARARRLTVEELQGGTFTITNLGAWGIESFTPIINVPQCAVLGMGRIVRQPVAADAQVLIRDRLTLSLTFDHRIVDGAPAARFLQTLGSLIENPGPWLIS